jgi:hypothetical protein
MMFTAHLLIVNAVDTAADAQRQTTHNAVKTAEQSTKKNERDHPRWPPRLRQPTATSTYTTTDAGRKARRRSAAAVYKAKQIGVPTTTAVLIDKHTHTLGCPYSGGTVVAAETSYEELSGPIARVASPPPPLDALSASSQNSSGVHRWRLRCGCADA